MISTEVLMNETKDLPPFLLQEVLDFVRFLKMRMRQDVLETTLLSESALEKDWLRPEEDAAWRSL